MLQNKECKFPFNKFIEEQYTKRLELKKQDNQLERAIKIVLNSMYGKTAQRVKIVCPLACVKICGVS